MVPAPVALGLTLCDYVIVEQSTNKASLIGTFSTFRGRVFPFPPLPFLRLRGPDRWIRERRCVALGESSGIERGSLFGRAARAFPRSAGRGQNCVSPGSLSVPSREL